MCHVLATYVQGFLLLEGNVSEIHVCRLKMALNFRTRDLTLYFARYLSPAAFTCLDIMIYHLLQSN
jgi:hypothetical protein